MIFREKAPRSLKSRLAFSIKYFVKRSISNSVQASSALLNFIPSDDHSTLSSESIENSFLLEETDWTPFIHPEPVELEDFLRDIISPEEIQNLRNLLQVDDKGVLDYILSTDTILPQMNVPNNLDQPDSPLPIRKLSDAVLELSLDEADWTPFIHPEPVELEDFLRDIISPEEIQNLRNLLQVDDKGILDYILKNAPISPLVNVPNDHDQLNQPAPTLKLPDPMMNSLLNDDVNLENNVLNMQPNVLPPAQIYSPHPRIKPNQPVSPVKLPYSMMNFLLNDDVKLENNVLNMQPNVLPPAQIYSPHPRIKPNQPVPPVKLPASMMNFLLNDDVNRERNVLVKFIPDDLNRERNVREMQTNVLPHSHFSFATSASTGATTETLKMTTIDSKRNSDVKSQEESVKNQDLRSDKFLAICETTEDYNKIRTSATIRSRLCEKIHKRITHQGKIQTLIELKSRARPQTLNNPIFQGQSDLLQIVADEEWKQLIKYEDLVAEEDYGIDEDGQRVVIDFEARRQEKQLGKEKRNDESKQKRKEEKSKKDNINNAFKKKRQEKEENQENSVGPDLKKVKKIIP